MKIRVNKWFTLRFDFELIKIAPAKRIKNARVAYVMGFPLVFFWGWYGLAVNDISLGTTFFSRQMHDLIFGIYGNLLGMEPENVPLLLAKTFAFDTVLVFGLAALRWHKSWLPQTKSWVVKKYQYLTGGVQAYELAMVPVSSIDTVTREPAIYPMRPAK